MNRNIKIILALCIGIGLGLLMENNFLIQEITLKNIGFFTNFNLKRIKNVNLVTFKFNIDKQLCQIKEIQK